MAMDYSTETATQLIPMGSGPASAPVARGINFKRLLRMRGPVMAVIALVLSVPLLVAVWFVIPREYESTAAIRFAHTKPAPLSGSQETAVASDYGQYVETNVNLIKSPAVLSLVAAAEEVRSLPEIAEQKDPVYYLSKKVNARVLPNSELVQVSYKSNDRNTALAIVKNTVNEFIKHASRAEQLATAQTTKVLEEERETLDSQLQDQRQKVQQQRGNVGGVTKESGGIGVDAERQSYFDNLSKAISEKETAESQVQLFEGELSQLQALIENNKTNPSAPIYEFGIETQVGADASVLVQTQLLAGQEVDLNQVQGKYRDDAAFLKAKVETRNSVANGVEDAKKKARQKLLLALESEKKLNLDKAQKLVQDASNRITEFDGELRAHADDTIEYGKAMSELKEAEDEMEDLRIKMRDVQELIRVARADSRAPASIDTAVTAQAPTAPDSKRRIKFMALVVVMSCGIAGAYGLFRELTDQQVRTALDLKFVTDLPMMALIPHSSIEKLPKNGKAALLTAEHPGSISADEFRRVLTRIIYPPEGSAELNTVLVTSASRGDGKTSMACNLAISLAQANRRVLLLDICARRPSVETTLGMERGEGLGEIFANTISMQQAIRPTSIPNLCVLGPGFLGNQLIGKLASRDTVEFLEKAEESFEHVIIDTPPTLLMADAKLLAPVVDGVIMVIGAEVSSLGMVRRALGELQQIGSNVIGVVLNKARHVPGGYMQDNMERYYNYGEEDGPVEGLEDRREETKPEPVDGDELPTMILLEDRGIRPKQK